MHCVPVLVALYLDLVELHSLRAELTHLIILLEENEETIVIA